MNHVLITGSAGAIGAAIARAIRIAHPTARLALVDRAPCDALAAELGNATAYQADLADLAALPALVERITAASPTARGQTPASSVERGVMIDGLVNCAGIMQVQQVQNWRWEDAERLLAVDLLAPLRLQDLVVRGMVALGRGSIVNVSSMAGKVPLRGCSYYGAAKAGLAMASEIARADLAAHGIRVVTVYPGPVKSALEQGARDAYGGGGLLGRLAPTGDPDELARRILHALDHDEPRVIYPRAYGIGWSANNLSRWFALSYGPPPVS